MEICSCCGAEAASLPGDHLLLLLAQSLDAERHDIAGLQELRRLHAEAHARRRACGDDITGFEHHELRDIGDDGFHIEDHGLGGARLHTHAVDVEPHVELLHVLDLVGGDKPGTERAEGFATLALHPLAAALDLILALGDVIAEAEAGNHRHRVFLRHIASALADHDGEFHFPISLHRLFRQHHIVIGPADAGASLVEQDGFGGNGSTRLSRVVGIIEPDRDEMADIADASAKPRLAFDQW